MTNKKPERPPQEKETTIYPRSEPNLPSPPICDTKENRKHVCDCKKRKIDRSYDVTREEFELVFDEIDKLYKSIKKIENIFLRKLI